MALLVTASNAPRCDVLILENDALIRVVTMAFLEDARFFVCEAANSAQALAMLAAIPCGVLLVDVALGPDSPVRDGRAVAMEAMRRHPGLAVIYSSGAPVELGRPLTARERVLTKPYRPHRLLDAVRDLLAAEARMLAG